MNPSLGEGRPGRAPLLKASSIYYYFNMPFPRILGHEFTNESRPRPES